MALGKRVAEREVFGEKVRIRTLNGGKEAAQVIELLQQVGQKPWLMAEIGALLVVCCLVDEQDQPIYTDPQQVRDDAAMGFLSEFAQVALSFSGLGDDAAELPKN